jgi:hypothetical protein
LEKADQGAALQGVGFEYSGDIYSDKDMTHSFLNNDGDSDGGNLLDDPELMKKKEEKRY